MRKVIALLVVCGSFAAIATPGALANNPHNEENPSGKPEFSCQEINPNKGGLNPFTQAARDPLLDGQEGHHVNELFDIKVR